MEQTKRSRSCTVDDNKRKKLEEATVNINRLSITHFEDLSNEVIYEIFESFDFVDVYTAFSNLNQRFENLLIDSTLPINVDISSLSKAHFQRCYKQIIIPFQFRTRSIRITNLFIYKYAFSLLRITTILSRLESLILHNIQLKYLENLLNYLHVLPKLSSLDIETINQIQNPTNIYHQIFRLPVLKYCKISFNIKSDTYSLPRITNFYSSIEHLVIKHSIHFDQLDKLLLFVPQLRCLSCLNIFQLKIERPRIQPIVLNKLTHVSLKMRQANFDQFKRWITNLIHQIQVLNISIKYDMSYLKANQWEELIINYLPHLQVFDIQHRYDVHHETKNNISYTEINQFNSSFWLKRKWFFEQLHESKKNWDNRLFYSTNPYRRKHFTLSGATDSSDKKIHLNTVHHLHIQNLQAITNCKYYFPNATKLTFEYICDLPHEQITNSLNCIILLKQLTKLDVDSYRFSFVQIIELLYSMPNLRIMRLESITNYLSIQQSEKFQLVSDTNIIINVTIEERCVLEEIKLIVALCPRLEHLTIRIAAGCFEPTLRLLLSKTNVTTHHLFSLCILDASKILVEILKNLIKSERLLHDYSFKFIENKLYLWW